MFRLFNIGIAQRFDYRLTARAEGMSHVDMTDDNKEMSFYGITRDQQWTITLTHSSNDSTSESHSIAARSLLRH